ncbi:MAG TPA: amidohydrolase family protein [Dehalococcoidia bacterium]
MRKLHWLVAATVAIMIVACGADGDPASTSAPANTPQSLTPTPAATASPTRPPPLPPVTPLLGSLAIKNACILDGTGASAIESGYVVVRDGYIVQVGRGEGDLPDDARIIDAEGRTVMPGLGDGHMHTTSTFIVNTGYLAADINEDAYVPFLSAGFTNLRDVGTPTVILRSVKEQTDIQTRFGNAPRITWSGPLITAPGGYPFTVDQYSAGGHEVRSAEEAVDLVDALEWGGARVVKLALEHGYFSDEGWPVLDLDTVRAISEAAHERGMRVTAHVTSLDEVRLALDGGVDDLAHTPLEPLTDELIAEMLERDMAMVTTATLWGARAVVAENAIRYAEAGGVVALGTDFGCCNQVPGGSAYLNEATFLASHGYPAADLVVAATRNAAIVSNAGDTTGTLEPGKLADIIVVDGKPDEKISALGNVDVVILGGQIVAEQGNN